MSRVGARTVFSRGSGVRSGRPPRDTTARIASGCRPASPSAAAAPVLAPKQPTGSCRVCSLPESQARPAPRRSMSSSMSKRSIPPRRSTASSPSVSRSSSSVARPSSFSLRATYWLRGLCRLLPVPCAKRTTPRARSGSARSPSMPTRPSAIRRRCGLDHDAVGRVQDRLVPVLPSDAIVVMARRAEDLENLAAPAACAAESLRDDPVALPGRGLRSAHGVLQTAGHPCIVPDRDERHRVHPLRNPGARPTLPGP